MNARKKEKGDSLAAWAARACFGLILAGLGIAGLRSVLTAGFDHWLAIVVALAGGAISLLFLLLAAVIIFGTLPDGRKRRKVSPEKLGGGKKKNGPPPGKAGKAP